MRIVVPGLAGLQRDLRRAVEECADLSEVWVEIQKVLDPVVPQTFASAGRGEWPSRQRLYPWPIMRHTGALMRSIRGKVLGKKIIYTSPLKYWKYHQFGEFVRRKIGGVKEAARTRKRDGVVTRWRTVGASLAAARLPTRQLMIPTIREEEQVADKMARFLEILIAGEAGKRKTPGVAR